MATTTITPAVTAAIVIATLLIAAVFVMALSIAEEADAAKKAKKAKKSGQGSESISVKVTVGASAKIPRVR